MDQRYRISSEAVVVGYALARLDLRLLQAMGWTSWRDAYHSVSEKLGEEANSIKLLRDEFDVFFPNGRRGWVNRDPHPSRLAVLNEFQSVSDEGLLEIVRHVLLKNRESVSDILELVEQPPNRVANVAERLRTGRRAEEYFLEFCESIIHVPQDSVVDMRNSACGYDFRSETLPGVAIEIKGLKGLRGDILFTDKEWTEAVQRSVNYWVVVVGNIAGPEPSAELFRGANQHFQPKCSFVPSTTTVWRAFAELGLPA